MNLDLRDDDVLLAVLSGVLHGSDPVPADAKRAAAAACELRHVDSELASLVADSSIDEGLLFRDEVGTLVMTFRCDQLSVEIEIDRDGQAVGVISPPVATELRVETPSTRGTPRGMSTRSDELGRFQIGVGMGLCRLRIGSGPEAVVTAWFYC